MLGTEKNSCKKKNSNTTIIFMEFVVWYNVYMYKHIHIRTQFGGEEHKVDMNFSSNLDKNL